MRFALKPYLTVSVVSVQYTLPNVSVLVVFLVQSGAVNPHGNLKQVFVDAQRKLVTYGNSSFSFNFDFFLYSIVSDAAYSKINCSVNGIPLCNCKRKKIAAVLLTF